MDYGQQMRLCYVYVRGGGWGESGACCNFVLRAWRCLVVVRVLRLMLVPDSSWSSVIRQFAFSARERSVVRTC